MRITQCKFKRFQQFAQRWLAAHVTAEQQQQCNEWLLGSSSSSTSTGPGNQNNWSLPKTKVFVQNDLKKTPYRPYQRYKVLSGNTGGIGGSSSSSGLNNFITVASNNQQLYNTAIGQLVNVSVANMNASLQNATTLSGGGGHGGSTQGLSNVNLNTLASVTALNAAGGGVGDNTTTTVTNLGPTPHCNSVTGLTQSSSVVVVQEQPAQVRPMES